MKSLLVIVALTAVLVCPGVAPAATVKIGLMAPITGAFASEGQDMKKILDLMVEEVNKTGGINGDTVELIVEDDGSTPRSAATAASRLVAADVPAVIGTYGSAVTEASQDIYDEAGVVQIGTGSTSVRLTAKGMKRFFRTCPRDDEQGRVAVGTLKRFGYAKVAILHDNSAYAKGLADEIKQGIEKEKSAAILFFDALVPGERDYSAILTKLKGISPDAVFFTGYYPEAGLLLRQMAEMKWSVPMIGGDATNNTDLVSIAGPAASGFRFISPPMPGDIDNQKAKDFLAAYQAQYNSQPSSIWSVAAGDAFTVIVAAIKAKGADPAAIADFLHTGLQGGIDSLTGTIAFDAAGDRIGDVYRLYEVSSDGRFVLQPKQ